MFGNGNGNAYRPSNGGSYVNHAVPVPETPVPETFVPETFVPKMSVPKEPKKLNHLTNEQREALNKLVKRVCKQDAEGFAIYNSAWSDDAVAAHFGIKPHHVKETRTVLVGALRPTGRPATKKSTVAQSRRISTLEQQVRDLQAVVEKYGLTG